MNIAINFVTVLAWIFGVLATLAVIFKLVISYKYEGSIHQSFDKMKGYTVNYAHRIMRYIIVALVCWAWIITIAICN